jgi:hypothetical protein
MRDDLVLSFSFYDLVIVLEGLAIDENIRVINMERRKIGWDSQSKRALWKEGLPGPRVLTYSLPYITLFHTNTNSSLISYTNVLPLSSRRDCDM